MPHLYEYLVQALQSHWRAHSNAYPQKFVLSPEQRATLDEARIAIHQAVTGKEVSDLGNFMGVRLEEQAGSPGEMVAVDGAVTSLGSYTKAGPAKG